MLQFHFFTAKAKKKKELVLRPRRIYFLPPAFNFFQPQNVKKNFEAVSRKSGFCCPFLSVSILSFIMYIFKAFVYIDMHLSDR